MKKALKKQLRGGKLQSTEKAQGTPEVLNRNHGVPQKT